jgi:hypothetical protein
MLGALKNSIGGLCKDFKEPISTGVDPFGIAKPGDWRQDGLSCLGGV